MSGGRDDDDKDGSKVFYFVGQGHTICSALREEMEGLEAENAERGDEDASIASCTVHHPLDSFVEVRCPSESFLRTSLLRVKDRLNQIRAFHSSSVVGP